MTDPTASTATDPPIRRTVRDAFDGGRNGLNLLRLMLATSVIVWHTACLGGFVIPFGLGEGQLSDFGVDGFFVISGFLITRSWDRRPRLLRYVWHRALRVLPGFWACLVVTAAVIAPLAWLYQHGGLSGYLDQAPVKYLTANFTLQMNEFTIGSTPADVPYPRGWNGSLWTLYWEALCYIGIAVLGVVGLLRRRPWVLVVVFAACLAATIMPQLGKPLHGEVGWLTLNGPALARFGLMFSAGALMYLYANRIPFDRRLAAVSAVIFLVAFLGSENYRAFAALPLAYLLVWLALALPGRLQRVGATNDLSYGVYIYAFPVQQLLATLSVYKLGYAAFLGATIAATLPLAAASWWLVEKRALRWKDLTRGRGARASRYVTPVAASTAERM